MRWWRNTTSRPEQYPDLAALRGETADNIPGVPGVGDGFAAKWINLYGGLDQIIEHADEIGGKKGEALRANIDQVKLNRSVNALVRRRRSWRVGIEDLTFGTGGRWPDRRPCSRSLNSAFAPRIVC